MAKQPFQLAKIHLVAIVRRLAKGILQQFSTIKRDYLAGAEHRPRHLLRLVGTWRYQIHQ